MDRRGGSRTGRPGATYTNRTDLTKGAQPVTSAPGQQYGQRAQQERTQQAIPLPRREVVPLNAPTMRPNEPVTSGAPAGPGPGPRELGITPGVGQADDALEELRAIYAAFPNEDLADLLENWRG